MWYTHAMEYYSVFQRKEIQALLDHEGKGKRNPFVVGLFAALICVSRVRLKKEKGVGRGGGGAGGAGIRKS
jgi:hypothetical protein